ncbi:zinc ribbon domain-containing protein [Halorarum halobium]|uniref:zinc ribbon domain-containing protein n=1 Tax=Halorarum halobium TaxID=3075121 RepID=UPI0028B1EDE6|nr:zinc ribbon domain-containing protein [Halobaculum sp. XH14]
MSVLQRLRDVLVPDTERGIVYECANCGHVVEEPRERCPECGSTEIIEQEGFDMRPDG